MKSLHVRLLVGLGVGVTLLWLLGAALAVQALGERLERSADVALATTAQRLLPLIGGGDRRDRSGRMGRRVAPLRPDMERFSYVVRDTQGQDVLRSSNAREDAELPPLRGRGFYDLGDRRVYQERLPGDGLSITVSEIRSERRQVLRQTYMAMIWPLAVVLPLTVAVIWFVLRQSLRPMRQWGREISTRDSADLSALDLARLPAELLPVGQSVNDLMGRLEAAFVAERAFAANAAHELRTPIAAARAQLHRLRAEAGAGLRARADELDAALQRLTRLSEKLMQLARAEGGRLRISQSQDLAPILHMVVQDLQREHDQVLDVVAAPVLSSVDVDIFGILARNLIENALRYGEPGAAVQVHLQDGVLEVSNDCPALAPEALARMQRRFERGAQQGPGAGLGLSIVTAIVDGIDAQLLITSPRPDHERGVFVRVRGL